MRQHGIEHYLDLVGDGRVDLTGMLTHTFRLDDWRDAFTALATQDASGAIKVAFDFRRRASVMRRHGEQTRRSTPRRADGALRGDARGRARGAVVVIRRRSA